MHIQLDRSIAMPLYRQIIGQVEAWVKSGDLPPGAELPSVRQLAREDLQFNMQIRQHDADGDGECDAVSTAMNQLRLQFNRTLGEGEDQLEPPAEVLEGVQQIGSADRALSADGRRRRRGRRWGGECRNLYRVR
ncbi:GntR family transcriptional regulator [bacterium]|nr:GntR family transcriptional regulator [bacterium]